MQTIIECDVPRVKCKEHGVKQISVPWAESKSHFTAMFEALVINWLKEASISAVADLCGLSWDRVAGIQERAVERGLQRRKAKPLKNISFDETSYQKRHGQSKKWRLNFGIFHIEVAQKKRGFDYCHGPAGAVLCQFKESFVW